MPYSFATAWVPAANLRICLYLGASPLPVNANDHDRREDLAPDREDLAWERHSGLAPG